MSKIQRSNNHFSLIFVSDWCRCDASASSVAFIFLDYIHIKIEGLTEIYAVQFIKCFIVRRTLVCISGAFVALLFGVSFLSPFFGFEKWAAFCITCLLYTFYTLYLKSHTIQIGLEYMSFSMYQDYYASNLAHNTWFKYEEKQISYLIRMNPHTHTLGVKLLVRQFIGLWKRASKQTQSLEKTCSRSLSLSKPERHT